MKKKTKRGPKDRFTDEQKAEALAMIWMRDLTIEQVATSMGISERTIRRWRVRLEQRDTQPKPNAIAVHRR